MAVSAFLRRIRAKRLKIRPSFRPRLELLEGRALLAGDVLNHSPVARNDSLTTSQAHPLFIASAKLLANDSDEDGDALKVTLVASSGPAHGTLSLSGSGDFYYIPKPDFSGSDSFQYFAWDGQAFSSAATVTINVMPIIFPPVARNDYYSTLVNTRLTVGPPGVLANDGQIYPSPLAGAPLVPPLPGGQGLQAELVVGPLHGSVSLSADGGFTYIPSPDYTGVDTFTYRDVAVTASPDPTATDTSPVTSNIATVTVAVRPLNSPPEAHNDYYNVAENATLTIAAPGVLANDKPPDGQKLAAAVLTGPAHGSVTLSASGGFTYIPSPGFTGLDSFTYQDSVVLATTVGGTTSTTIASDPIGGVPTVSNVATVYIYVRPLVPPPEAHNDTYSTPADTTLTVTAPGVLQNDLAVNGHTLTAKLLHGTEHGSVTLNSDGGFTYVPSAGFSGYEVFAYQAVDSSATTILPPAGALTASGDPNAPLPGPIPPEPVHSDIAYVTILVTPIRPPIEAHNDAYVVGKNTDLDVAAPGVLGNDYGPAGVPLVAAVDHPPEHGSLTLNSDGSFHYSPAADFLGDDKFTYWADNGAAASPGVNPMGSLATVTIYVVAVDPLKPFVLGADQHTTDESGPQSVPAYVRLVTSSGDADPKFVVSTDRPKLFSAPPQIDANGILVYSPAPNASGSATVTVSVDDSGTAGYSSTFAIHVVKPHPLHDTEMPCDVGGDHAVAPDDALLIINYLNADLPSEISDTGLPVTENTTFYDVDADNSITPTDALIVINWLNASPIVAAPSPAGEASDPSLVNLGVSQLLVAMPTASAAEPVSGSSSSASIVTSAPVSTWPAYLAADAIAASHTSATGAGEFADDDATESTISDELLNLLAAGQ